MSPAEQQPSSEQTSGPGQSSADNDDDDNTTDGADPFVLTLATYNVENFDLGGDGESQHRFVAEFAAGFQLDVLVIQEMQSSGDGADTEAFDMALVEAGHVLDHSAVSALSDGYNAIGLWSRYPIVSWEEILADNTRTVLRVEIDVGAMNWWFYGVHLKSGADAMSQQRRRDEACALEQYLVTAHGASQDQVVLLGDMNTMSDPDWESAGTLSCLTLASDNPEQLDNDFVAINYTELPDEPTNPGWSSLLDHILLSPSAYSHYVPDSVQVPHPAGDGEFGPSDHYPVVLQVMVDD